jgi:hypothetical protein
VASNLYLVFSKPPADVSPGEFDAWYEHHCRENILTPGFVAAQRYRATPVIAGTRVAPGRFSGRPGGADPEHLALYEYNGDIDTVRADLLARVESGDVVLPAWFDRISFTTWNCEPIDDRVEVALRAG